MARLIDVAQRAGVSIATVSRVINRSKNAERISEGCAERVRAAAKEVGYAVNHHAQSMRLPQIQTQTIAVALEIGGPKEDVRRQGVIETPYFGGLIGGVEAVIHNHGYTLTLMGPGPKASATDRVVLGLREQRFDGIVIPSTLLKSESAGILRDAPELPIVVIQPRVETDLTTVDFNHAAGIGLMVDHLEELGHTELLWVGPRKDCPMAAGLREQYFMTTVWDHQLRGATLPLLHGPNHDYCSGPPLMEQAEQAMSQYLQSPQSFTAVACYNDEIAVGVMHALMRAGRRVPEDVSVIGFDNTQAYMAWPPLTTIDHHFNQLGSLAAELVLQMVKGKSQAIKAMRGHRELLEPTLVVRESTGPALGKDDVREP